MKSDGIPLFEASLRISNEVVKMYQKLVQLNFPIGEEPKQSYMFGLDDTRAELNLGNLY